MTVTDNFTVESLHNCLDSVPDDQNARLALADAIRDAGGNGDVYEALARMGWVPEYYHNPRYNARWWAACYRTGVRTTHIPRPWLEKVPVGIRGVSDTRNDSSNANWHSDWLGTMTRRELEEVLNTAFQLLPDDLKQKYLRGDRD